MTSLDNDGNDGDLSSFHTSDRTRVPPLPPIPPHFVVAGRSSANLHGRSQSLSNIGNARSSKPRPRRVKSRGHSASSSVEGHSGSQQAGSSNHYTRPYSERDFLTQGKKGQTVVTGFEYGPYSYDIQQQRVQHDADGWSLPQPGQCQGQITSPELHVGKVQNAHHPNLKLDPRSKIQRQFSDDSYRYTPSSSSHSSHHSVTVTSSGEIIETHPRSTAHSRSHSDHSHHSRARSLQNSDHDAETLVHNLHTPNAATQIHFIYDSMPVEREKQLLSDKGKLAETEGGHHVDSDPDEDSEDGSLGVLSIRGGLNVLALLMIALVLIGVFLVLPVVHTLVLTHMGSTLGAWNLGGTNASGQVPDIPGLPTLIDAHTPKSAMTRTSFNGEKMKLVFSDEFEVDGRTFWPGDDPYWEAVDLHYWGTDDYEWYDPDAMTTKDGSLEITMTKQRIHDLDYRSGMLQSWNKLCFQGGYIEARVSLPGSGSAGGFWPGVWTMGNLGRAAYGASTDGVWPFSYNTCDLGTLPNQTDASGGPAAVTTSSGTPLSYQPGQKLSACTCKGEDHPGPNVKTGRGAPEIDLLEAQTGHGGGDASAGAVSQSAQVAPYDADYSWSQDASTIYNSSKTFFNSYKGGVYQESLSGVTYLDPVDEEGFGTYGYEIQPGVDSDSYITWAYNEQPTWTLTSATFGANSASQVFSRVVSTEPMYVVMNLALSDSFQTIDWDSIQFPGVMKIDYVRIYQKSGQIKIGCDPDDHPTAQYIEKHLDAYSNPNLTTWDQAGYEFPRNSLLEGCS